ncbi:acyl-homoserine-lactone synthase [Methylobacterium nodulans]|nr:acyl-homoserine-lactone synthase [Methylobacterium nodulans]
MALTRHAFGANFDLVTEMHRLRARIFKGRLDWDVAVAGDMEIDRYDALEATYLLLLTPARKIAGHVRFLPTTGPNMLADTFPDLLDGGPAPKADEIVESSRFCIDGELASPCGENGIAPETPALFALMLEWSLMHRKRYVATVTDAAVERILRRCGWPLERLGGVHKIGNSRALAGLLPVTAGHLAAVRKAAGLTGPLLLSENDHAQAA